MNIIGYSTQAYFG